MKKLSYIFLLIFLGSCTSNTIFKKPEDLIPRDTMSLLVQEMMIASSSKFVKNKNQEKNINYMPFVYDRFKIDSIRFNGSNLYYMSKIDLYKEIFSDAKANLDKQVAYYNVIKKEMDSIRKDSISKVKMIKKKEDSIKKQTIIEKDKEASLRGLRPN
ncbi:DUF4296 domain-containing protein [Polaribacter vadi]|uniref:DUF4296 domain-containing protein n=1 Tax=Polaribacter TaxID=52959 RepID=UPI001C09C43E|nr:MULTISPECIES: DUF4296 domain-containing protein [Polaribacter]MBU3011510.1 DUF4296 domain-containing protein [Polaribacter vadi]MDO6741322.1 DUF4296 domain-containing protein [Polaribacter sp. 1_MG-2023]